MEDCLVLALGTVLKSCCIYLKHITTLSLVLLEKSLGLLVFAYLVFLYASLIFYGFKLALNFKQNTTQLVISGLFSLIGLQAVFNMGVVLGLLPTKGLNLPFFSYGGSSLICNFFGLGLIVSALKKNIKLSKFVLNIWQEAMISLLNGKKIHIVGVGGIGMSAIAEILLNLGCSVSGSDLSEGPNTRKLQSWVPKFL